MTPVDLTRSTLLHSHGNSLGSRLHRCCGVSLPADQIQLYDVFRESSTLLPNEALCSGHSSTGSRSGLPCLVSTPLRGLEPKASHSPQVGRVGSVCFWIAVRSNTLILVIRMQLTRLAMYS